jgi:hypothetical protein
MGYVLVIYLVTRALIRLGFAFAFIHVPFQPGYADPSQPWLRWDSLWYLRIAIYGYHWTSTLIHRYQSTAFFPLYPVTIRALHALGLGYDQAALVSANVAGLGAAWFFDRYAIRRLGEEEAKAALVTFLLFPTSLYLSAGYASAWLAFGAALALYAVTERRFVLATCAAALASASESTGAAVAVLVAVAAWQAGGAERRRAPLYFLAGLAGLFGYMLYLGLRFHDPLAFLHAEAAWLPPIPLRTRLVRLLTLQPFLRLGDPWSLDLPILVVFVATAVAATVRRFFTGPEAVFVWCILLVSVWVHALPANSLMSMARITSLALPLFLALGPFLGRRRDLFGLASAALAAGLLIYAMLYGQGWWVE